MEIKASCIYDEKAITALNRASFIQGKSNPKILIIIFSIFSLVLITEFIYLYLNYDLNTASLMLTLLALAINSFLFYGYFIMPKRQCKMMAKTANLKNTYIFKDDYFQSFADNEYMESNEKSNYSVLVSVKETKDYFFLYIKKNTAFIVDKSSLDIDDLEKLQSKFSELLGKKYYKCKY